jgi:hypothetical protein
MHRSAELYPAPLLLVRSAKPHITSSSTSSTVLAQTNPHVSRPHAHTRHDGSTTPRPHARRFRTCARRAPPPQCLPQCPRRARPRRCEAMLTGTQSQRSPYQTYKSPFGPKYVDFFLSVEEDWGRGRCEPARCTTSGQLARRHTSPRRHAARRRPCQSIT